MDEFQVSVLRALETMIEQNHVIAGCLTRANGSPPGYAEMIGEWQETLKGLRAVLEKEDEKAGKPKRKPFFF
jgi:hypothetical protein